jgi:uncharacterized iron-regulated membrane protein
LITEDHRGDLAAEARPDVPEPPTKQKRSAKQSGLYRAVWRWHFYAGLFSIPVIVMLCLTGIVYLFKPQIESVLYGHLTRVAPGARSVSYQAQLQAVTAAYPSATVSSVTPPLSATGATEFEIVRKGAARKLADFALDYSVFVNPHTGRVIGHRDNSKDPVNVAVTLHGTLATQRFLGSSRWGGRLIEIVASWSVLLLLTGIFLWWPRGTRRSSLKGVLVPRTEAPKGSRTRWRDVHAITGVLFASVTAFFLLTGMLWTQVAGTNIHKLVKGTFGQASAQTPPSTKIKDVDPTGPWATSQVPVPPSARVESAPVEAPQYVAAQAGDIHWNPRDGAPLDAVVARAQQLGFAPGYAITMPSGDTGSFVIGTYPDLDAKPNQRVSGERFAFVDQYTAQVLGELRHTQIGLFGRAMDTGVALHEGRQLGIWNQVASLIAVGAVLLSCATSIVMWRKRRPAGLGAPKPVPNRRINLAIFAVALVLGVALPLLGMTLLTVVVFESLIVHRVPRLARALGAA